MPTLTNMLTNPGFASNLNDWNGLQDSWSAGRLALLATARYQNSNQRLNLTSGHKYYHRSTLEATSASNAAYSGLNGYFGTYCWLQAANTPTMVSNITAATATATVGFIAIGENRASGFNTMYADNCMVVDLTAAYGAGSEPDKATCDAWPFFADTVVDAADSLLAKITESASVETGFTLTAVQDGTHIDLSWT